jgi:hypothetical protein
MMQPFFLSKAHELWRTIVGCQNIVCMWHSWKQKDARRNNKPTLHVTISLLTVSPFAECQKSGYSAYSGLTKGNVSDIALNITLATVYYCTICIMTNNIIIFWKYFSSNIYEYFMFLNLNIQKKPGSENNIKFYLRNVQDVTSLWIRTSEVRIHRSKVVLKRSWRPKVYNCTRTSHWLSSYIGCTTWKWFKSEAKPSWMNFD